MNVGMTFLIKALESVEFFHSGGNRLSDITGPAWFEILYELPIELKDVTRIEGRKTGLTGWQVRLIDPEGKPSDVGYISDEDLRIRTKQSTLRPHI